MKNNYRHETPLVVRMTNTFKLEKWHSMVISKSHHPTNLSQELFIAMMEEVTLWAKEVQENDPKFR